MIVTFDISPFFFTIPTGGFSELIITRYDPVYEATAAYSCPKSRTVHDLPTANSWHRHLLVW